MTYVATRLLISLPSLKTAHIMQISIPGFPVRLMGLE